MQRTGPSTLADLLQQGDPDHTAIVVPDGPSVTYGALDAQVESLAASFQASGLGHGSVVSLVQGNDLPFVTTFLAVTRAGAVAAPLNPAYTADELRFYMEDAGAQAVVMSAGQDTARQVATSLGLTVLVAQQDRRGAVGLSRDGQPLVGPESVRLLGPEAVALFLHTSGTTSRPKGVPLTHANLVASVANIVQTYNLGPEDTSLAVMPLFHVHGLIGVVLSTLAAGGTSVLAPRFSASAFWPTVADHHVTWYSAVPTIHQTLVMRADDDKAPTGALRFIRSCSAALSPTLLEQMEARFGAPVLEAYGMTEASHQMASNPLPPAESRAGTVGPATGTTRTAIMDEAGVLLPDGQQAEVVIQGPNVTEGYHNNPEANAASFTNSWFRTGDQGVIEAGGYLRLTGRLKELINRAGEKISPLEVDEILARHPAVAEAVTFGVPDAKYGEEVHAAVVLKAEATEDELRRFCLEHMADFKTPKVVHFLDALPRTATGKIQRRQIAAHVAEQN